MKLLSKKTTFIFITFIAILICATSSNLAHGWQSRDCEDITINGIKGEVCITHDSITNFTDETLDIGFAGAQKQPPGSDHCSAGPWIKDVGAWSKISDIEEEKEKNLEAAKEWCKTPSSDSSSGNSNNSGNSGNNTGSNNGNSGSNSGSNSNSTTSSSNNSQLSSFSGTCRDFLGLTSWDCNVDISNEDSLKSGIWTIVANIAVDITVIAAYLIIGYTIYGGYLYTFSGGDPGKVATGKKALYHAFLGLAIVMSANVILNSIRIALSANFSTNCVTVDCGVDTGSMVVSAINWVIGIAGVVSAIFVVYGGISYATSAGEPSKLQKAKSMITYALIGLAIVALAETITAFVSNMVREANQTSLIQPIKEVHEDQKIS